MDVNVSYAVTVGLRLRGVDVLTAQRTIPRDSRIRNSSLERAAWVEFSSRMTMTCFERQCGGKRDAKTSRALFTPTS